MGDTNAASTIPEESLNQWISEGIITYLGKTEDVRPHLHNADCVELPSYREGTPRSLLEAAALEKPIVTTNVPSCRNVVNDNENGLLCEVKNATDLAKKMNTIASMDFENRNTMGARGRRKMETQFDEKLVINAYFNALNLVPHGRFRIRKKLMQHMTT